MSTFIAGTALGTLVAYLTGLDPEQLQILFGVLFGAACALCALYLYVLAQQPTPAPQPSRTRNRRQVRKVRRYPAGLPLTGAYALAGGAA